MSWMVWRDGGGGGGWGEFVWEEEHLHAFTYTTKAKWNGGGRGLWTANILVTANLCFTRPKEIIWITVD